MKEVSLNLPLHLSRCQKCIQLDNICIRSKGDVFTIFIDILFVHVFTAWPVG